MDIKVNRIDKQRGCENQDKLNIILCSHEVANILRDLIIRRHEIIEPPPTATRPLGLTIDTFFITLTSPKILAKGNYSYTTKDIFDKKYNVVMGTLIKVKNFVFP